MMVTCSMAGVRRNRGRLIPKLAAVVKRKPSAHWLEGLENIGISSGPINALDQVFADGQVQARDMAIEMSHPLAGDSPVKMIGSPIKLSATPVSYRRAPPTLGQHTDAVLEELLGLDAETRAGLRERGVI